MSRYVLGIDTSNYKTSIAVIDEEYRVICDERSFLNVKKGERGLRQSDAFFQHVQKLPELIERIPVDLGDELAGVFWSKRPRPVKGSYMPVFTAGESIGRSIASASGVLGAGFSHQEGHIEAVRHDVRLGKSEKFLACHFSGGTTEILHVSPRIRDIVHNTGVFYDIEIVGGTKDIALGQVLDRAGVAMGLSFPSGEYLDEMACSTDEMTEHLTKIRPLSAYVNLSGIDTQVKRRLEKGLPDEDRPAFAREIMTRLSEAVADAISQASNITGTSIVLMAGGVSSSRFMREYFSSSDELKGLKLLFGSSHLSQDNAVGTAILGGRYLWD